MGEFLLILLLNNVFIGCVLGGADDVEPFFMDSKELCTDLADSGFYNVILIAR